MAQRHHGAGFVSHIENYWDEPRLVRWLNKLGSFCRVDLFGKRGTVLSDWVAHLPAMDDEWTISPLSRTRLALSAQLDLPKAARSPRFLLTVIPNRASRYILYVAFANKVLRLLEYNGNIVRIQFRIGPKGVVCKTIEQLRRQYGGPIDPLNLTAHFVQIWCAEGQVEIIRFIFDVERCIVDLAYLLDSLREPRNRPR